MFSRGSPRLAVSFRATRLTGCDTAPHAPPPEIQHHSAMPRSSAQSDFVVEPRAPQPGDRGWPAAAADEPQATVPTQLDAVQLPRAVGRTPYASERSTKIVMTLTFIVLAALVLLTLVGAHIPSGE